MNLNKTFVLGRLTADPELRSTTGGTPVMNIGVATNRQWTDKNGQKTEEVEYHNVVLYAKQAEIAAQYLRKGSLALFEGRLRTRKWEDKQGFQRQATEIICENLQLGPAPAGAAKPEPAAAPSAAERPTASLDDDAEDTGRRFEHVTGGSEIKPEDIPF